MPSHQLNNLNALMAQKAKQLGDALEKRVRSIATDIHSEVVQATPVLTGRARINWQAGTTEPTNVLPAPATPGSAVADAVAAAAPAIAAFKLGQSIYIANNVDYIGLLDDGSSKQAPINFVRSAISRAVAAQNGTVLIK